MSFDISNLEFTSEAERSYFAEAHLGLKVQEFLTSEVGRYLHGRAKIEYEEAKQSILELEQGDHDFISQFSKLKMTASTAEKFMMWCADAINSGVTAEAQLNSLEDN